MKIELSNQEEIALTMIAEGRPWPGGADIANLGRPWPGTDQGQLFAKLLLDIYEAAARENKETR